MKTLLPALVCFLVGGLGCLVVMGAHGSAGVLFAEMVISLACWMAGFLLFLRWRDRYAPPANPLWAVFRPAASSARETKRARLATTAAEGARGLYGLEPGVTYRVAKSFTDYHDQQFEVGTELTFEGRDFLPYHGGHTLRFTPRKIYLQEVANGEVIARFDDHLVRAEPAQTAASRPPPLPKSSAPPLRGWQRKYSSTEYVVIELTAEGVRFCLDSFTRYSQDWTYAEVLDGKRDETIRGEFDEATLSELKSAIQERITASVRSGPAGR